MKTDELIERLGRDVTVSKPLPPPGTRTAAWMLWAVIYLIAVGLVMFALTASIGVMPTPLYLVQQSAALLTGITAARAAFASVIPGANTRGWAMPAIGAGTWSVTLLWTAVLDRRVSATLVMASQSDWPCVASIVIGGLFVGLPLVWMLRRGAPLAPRLTAFLAALAALSLANVQACLTRPHAFAFTVLLWHGGTVAASAVLCALMGHRWLRWPDITPRSDRWEHA